MLCCNMIKFSERNFSENTFEISFHVSFVRKFLETISEGNHHERKQKMLNYIYIYKSTVSTLFIFHYCVCHRCVIHTHTHHIRLGIDLL